MDLMHPERKMSKSEESAGTVLVLDDLAVTRKKFKRAVTDSDNEVRFDTERKPGVSNLLSILGAATGEDPAVLATKYEQYGPLKNDTADAVAAVLEPIQARYQALVDDPAETERLLHIGADKARERASATLARAKDNIGLLHA